MQLRIIHYDSFRRHTRNYLEPAIVHKWNADQNKLFRKLQEGRKVAVAGEMRAVSTGKFIFRSNNMFIWSLLIIIWITKNSTT